MILLVLAYQLFLDFECRATDFIHLCGFLSSLVGRTITVLVASGLFLWAKGGWQGQRSDAPGYRPDPLVSGPDLGTFDVPSGQRDPKGRERYAVASLALHFAGVALLFAPLFSAVPIDDNVFFVTSVSAWLVGAFLAGLGALLWIASARSWFGWLARERWWPFVIVAAAAMAPDIVSLILPLWNWQVLTGATFAAAAQMVSILGLNVHADPARHVFGVDGFLVEVGQPCAGLEGIVLISGFILHYGVLFRRSLNLWRFFILLLPLGLVLSWLLNAVRIAALVVMGARVSPEIAVNGFHSHAGWMFFAMVSLGLIAVVHAVPGFQRNPAPRPAMPFRDDWLAACILPFSVFVLTGAIAPAFTIHPDQIFPARMLAVSAVLAVLSGNFWDRLISLDLAAMILGGVVAAGWVATQVDGTSDPDLTRSLSQSAVLWQVTWVLSRLVGGAVLVPVVEELFFRGYLQDRMDVGGRLGRVISVAGSSLLFAALHERWIVGFLAGVVFAMVKLRRDRVSDAILCHVVANSLIALWSARTLGWFDV
ncbi:exosortase E/protease, VPEID-CTERM system [Rubellimicrobium arenae]|uniref:exosortase E/protease, VPEID-CTERM system n=1 Tax=Rubellimicrobium arenae TaxID=2817372 RepID=UPI001B3047A1|nr:exosortase E/protease, VPEID-CTERM system [Rubellimicrobium arenae]